MLAFITKLDPGKYISHTVVQRIDVSHERASFLNSAEFNDYINTTFGYTKLLDDKFVLCEFLD